MSSHNKRKSAVIFGIGFISCIASSFRLYHTVNFSREADTMWYIGPLIFWADVESACGFLIFTAISLPKMVRESSFFPRVKRTFGITSHLTSRLNKNSVLGTGSSYYPGATPQRPVDGNHELRDDISSENPKAGSREHLWEAAQV